jgi:ABC-type sugar transport system ATPase subunit
MDEPTAPLDGDDRRTLYDLIRQLAATGTSIIFISHDLAEVLTVCTRISVMRDGALVDTKPANEWTADRLISAMMGAAVATSVARAPHTDDAVVFRAHGVSVPGRVDDVSFDVRRGEVLGIAGLVGSGRSELLRAIFGADRRASGRIEIAGKVRPLPASVREAIELGIGMVPEDRKAQGLLLSRTAHFNIALGNAGRASRFSLFDRSAMVRRFRKAANDVRLAPDRFGSPVGDLSGGNQQKVLLARWLVRSPPILLLDEPSRGVDIAARGEIYSTIAALASSGVGVVLVSSDIDEVIQNSDRVLIMQAGRRVGLLDRTAADLASVLKLKFSADGRAS